MEVEKIKNSQRLMKFKCLNCNRETIINRYHPKFRCVNCGFGEHIPFHIRHPDTQFEHSHFEFDKKVVEKHNKISYNSRIKNVEKWRENKCQSIMLK